MVAMMLMLMRMMLLVKSWAVQEEENLLYLCHLGLVAWDIFVHKHNSCRPQPTLSSRAAEALLESVLRTVELGRAYARDDLFVDVFLVDKCVQTREEAIKE